MCSWIRSGSIFFILHPASLKSHFKNSKEDDGFSVHYESEEETEIAEHHSYGLRKTFSIEETRMRCWRKYYLKWAITEYKAKVLQGCALDTDRASICSDFQKP